MWELNPLSLPLLANDQNSLVWEGPLVRGRWNKVLSEQPMVAVPSHDGFAATLPAGQAAVANCLCGAFQVVSSASLPTSNGSHRFALSTACQTLRAEFCYRSHSCRSSQPRLDHLLPQATSANGVAESARIHIVRSRRLVNELSFP
jgi:hypothetical protein